MSLLSRPRTLVALLVVLSFALWGAASLRRVDVADSYVVIDVPVLGIGPRLAEPGWRLVPRFLGRISVYPASPRKLSAELAGERAASSREGAKVEVETQLTY